MKSFPVWKAQRDPYYAGLVRAGADEAQLLRAGFFDDGLPCSVREHPSWAPSWPVTPTGKLRANLPRDGSTPLVLLTTGAFSPVHDGHLALMSAARQACEQAGYRVVAGYYSPSHDVYVDRKQDGQAAMHCENRIALLEEAVAHSDWLDVCPWESRYAPAPLNFTDVLDRLELYLAEQLGRPVQVVYVFGSDNAEFLHAFLEKGMAVCIQRPGATCTGSIQVPAPCRSRWLFGHSSDTGASSTQVRAGALDLVPQAARPRYRALKASHSPACDAPLYLVREDLAHGTKNWPALVAGAGAKFERDLVSLIQESFEAAGQRVQVRGLDLAQQRSALSRIENSTGVLSLDVCAPARHNLGFSRAFEVAAGQVFSQQLVARPGFAPLDAQLATLPHGTWTVVDDDRASGFTERTVATHLATRGHTVAGFRHLNEVLLREQGLQERVILDVVDARDFLLGAADAGLVVRLADGQLARAPYMLPFVNLVFRAKFAPAQVYSFCQAVWQLNATWFETYAPRLRVADADPASQALLLACGFERREPLSAVARTLGEWLRACQQR